MNQSMHRNSAAILLAVLILLTGVPAFAGGPVDTTTTLTLVPPTVAAGGAASAIMKVVTTSGGFPVTQGTLQLKYKHHANPALGPVSCAAQGNSFLDVAGASGTPDAQGQVTIDLQALALTAVPGTYGFQANYSGVPGQDAKSDSGPCLDLTVTNAPTPCIGTVNIAANFVDGEGYLLVGGTYTWHLNLKVTACVDVTNVSAQGGLNAWATSTLGDPDLGSTAIRKTTGNGKNQVIIWTIGNMASGTEANLPVTVTGTVKKGTACGTVLGLLGSWSSLFSTNGGFTIQKTDYTGTSTVNVGPQVCP